ncbi:MAG: thioredoxin domain-containing protein [Pseudomonadales bacterium]|nr:thioredoxin domain-containing protein [Pseudomonadales bacterium]
MKNIPLLIATIVGTLLLIVVVAFMFSGSSNSAQDGQVVVDSALVIGDARNSIIFSDPQDLEISSELNVQDSNNNLAQMASESSELIPDSEVVTIVEFSDFQCPACKNAAPVAMSIIDAFPGKVRLIFRYFPLDSIHPNARKAAIAAEAVSSINRDKFWGMHDLLFENQETWSGITDRDELTDTFVTYAEKLDIDRTQFLERIEDNSVIEMVTNDSNVGNQLGVNSTPTFYVNGIKVSAPQLYTTVESLLVSNE